MDIEKIKLINDVVRDLNWQDQQIDTSDNSHYSFWLEHENEIIRILSYEIWLHDYDNSATIVEFIEGKFATINRIELEQLIHLLGLNHAAN